MQILKDYTICENAIEAMEPEDAIVFNNTRGDILSITINGAAKVKVEGANVLYDKKDPDYEEKTEDAWNTIGCIAIANFGIAEVAQGPGLFECGIEGARKVRVWVSEIAPGADEITVHAIVACSSD